MTAGLAESNGSLPSEWLKVTCRLTACRPTPGSASGATLGNEYGQTLPLYSPNHCLTDVFKPVWISVMWMQYIYSRRRNALSPLLTSVCGDVSKLCAYEECRRHESVRSALEFVCSSTSITGLCMIAFIIIVTITAFIIISITVWMHVLHIKSSALDLKSAAKIHKLGVLSSRSTETANDTRKSLMDNMLCLFSTIWCNEICV